MKAEIEACVEMLKARAVHATKPTQIRIPPDLLRETDARAREEGRSRTNLILWALRKYLQQAAQAAQAAETKR